MIPYKDALSLILKNAERTSKCRLVVDFAAEDSVGLVCAEDIVSSENFPFFCHSAMDGYALKSEWTKEASPQNPKIFKVSGVIAAGDFGYAPTDQVGCVEIMTGAMLPEVYDSVVRLEDVHISDGMIELTRSVRLYENVRRVGEDFKIGDSIVNKGVMLEPEHLMAFSALGIERVNVHQKPRVAILSTGKELSVGRKPELGQIRNSTAPFLISALKKLGISVEYHGIVQDDPAEFMRKVRTVLSDKPDVLITTGAVSMGRHDFIAASVRDLGGDMYFHKVAIRPGKPILFAGISSTAWFGLPGNPISTLVGMRFFVLPYLNALLGQVPEQPFHALLSASVKKPRDFRCFYKANIALNSQNQIVVKVHPQQASFMIRPLLEMNAWAILPEGSDDLDAGAFVEVLPFYPARFLGDFL